MSLIPDCLYPTFFDQDRQYRKTRTSLVPAEGRGPFLLSCLIRTVLRRAIYRQEWMLPVVMSVYASK
jgi:hypothetical protein